LKDCSYETFLLSKTQDSSALGFEPVFMPDFLFDFQAFLTEWGIRKGRAAYFADCGMGKTPMELVWGQNVVQHTNKPVLHLTPLAVSAQTVREGEKFGIEVKRSPDGKVFPATINVTNYERLHYFDPNDFAGVVCDESSCLKSFDSVRRGEITEFMRKMPYRLLGTATAAPNDYIELGTSSEALGELGHMDMLQRFFKNDQNTIRPMMYRNKGQNFQQLDDRAKWRFKGHAKIPFWRWICSWARACRKPSDVGFEDGAFILPPLIEQQYTVESRTLAPGMLFPMPAISLPEQREERRRTIQERCEKVADLVNDGEQALIWCHLNDESNLLEELIPDAVQVSGEDEDEEKEEKFLGFSSGAITRLISKPKIGAWGLNFQNCAHVTSFPSHSFESYYQSIRRCWRFGQKRPVRSDIVTTEGERDVMANLQRKAKAADEMFSALVEQMNYSMSLERSIEFTAEMEVPQWL
jgi:hypothetical protein